MKIGLPIKKESGKAPELAEDFRTSEYFGIIDIVSKEMELISEDMLYTVYGGKSLIEVLQSEDVEHVITKNIMSMSLKVFAESKIAVYKAKAESIEENLQLFKEFSLALFTANEATKNSTCGTSCAGCDKEEACA